MKARRVKTIPRPTPVAEEPAMVKARKLPMFGPGIVITVPLALLPAYMELYSLTPVRRRIADLRSPYLLVKREPMKEKV